MKYLFVGWFFLFSVSKLYAQEIKIYIWEDFISEQVIEAFTAQTGHQVKLYYYDNELDRNAFLINSSVLSYDLVLVDNITAQQYGKHGVFQPLPLNEIDNLQYIGKSWQNSCSEYGLPYAKGTLGIAYRSSVSDSPIESWHDLLSPPQAHIGTTMMLKDDIDSLAIALLAQQLPPFTQNADDLRAAHQLLQAQSEYLMGYGYPLSYTLEKGSGSKLTLAPLYSGDLQNIKNNTGQSDWQYVVPKEGTLFFVDCFAAPAGKKLSAASKAFLNYINNPKIAYQNASDIWFSTTNEGALRYADQQYKNDPELNPNPDILATSHDYQSLPKEQMILRNKILSVLKIKSKQQ